MVNNRHVVFIFILHVHTYKFLYYALFVLFYILLHLKPSSTLIFNHKDVYIRTSTSESICILYVSYFVFI